MPLRVQPASTNTKPFDFEERIYLFAKEVSAFVMRLPRNVVNQEHGRQLVRSSGSIGANYIEANEGLSKKDRIKCMKIARKEAKESRHWLRLLETQGNQELERKREELIAEVTELLRILSAMIQNSK